MQVTITKIIKSGRADSLLNSLAEKHGSLNSLSQKVSISKCSSRDQMTDLVLWRNLRDGADYEEKIVFENSEIFDILSPRRVDLLEYIVNHEPKSIRHLSESLHRNYKNVYDDIKALMKFELLELESSGRSRRPVCFVSDISLSYDD